MFARLLLLFITVPLVELVLLLRLGSRIGLPATIAIIFLTGALGAWLARTQGLSVLHRAQRALAEGRLPQEEVLEGILVLVAGAVLLTPGFLTDAVGFFLLIPPCRQWLRPHLTRYLRGRIHVVGPGGEPFEPRRRPEKDPDEVVIDAEVLSEEPLENDRDSRKLD